MKKNTIVLFMLLFAAQLTAQEFGIKFKGFVKTDFMMDTRQTVSVREGHFLLYPQPESLDANGDDLNAGLNLNILSIQTRLTGMITGPDAFGAKTSGIVEGAFFGHSDGDVNGFRLRHAFIQMDWDNSTLLIGQYWHPMFITEVFPGVVSFNTGVPFQPFSRNPQIRLVRKMSRVFLTLTAASQRDFASTGPNGTSSEYLRNAALPILDANLKYTSDKVVLGAGVNYKSLMPRTVTTAGLKTDARINSIAAMGFAKFIINKATLKLETIYGENLTDLLMLGGYAVHSRNGTTGVEEYTGIKTHSTWGEFICGGNVKFGLFAGYTKNLGASAAILSGADNSFYRGNTIQSVMRISPRIEYRKGNTQFATEIEYTQAAYGTPDEKGVIENGSTVANLRFLFAAYLFF
ncbi:hypothetical protein JXO52_10495 [bacterium]|nr:hypothetical protein [bacterium]